MGQCVDVSGHHTIGPGDPIVQAYCATVLTVYGRDMGPPPPALIFHLTAKPIFEF